MYVTEPCCNLQSHCTHRDIMDSTLKINCDLFRLRNFIQKKLDDLPKVKVIAAGDLLVGGKCVAPSDVVEATKDWGAVHGPAAAYARMAVNFIDHLKSASSGGETDVRKRQRSDSMDSTASSAAARPRTNTGSGSIISIGSGLENRGRGRGGFARPLPMHGRGSGGYRGRGGWRGSRRGR